MTRYRGTGGDSLPKENAPSNWVENVYYLFIVEMENVPDDTRVEDLPRVSREPGNAVARFEVVGNMEPEQAVLMLLGKAFMKGWSSDNCLSFITRSYSLPHFLSAEGGEE
tara:strand:+ start:803 stop:1132 length:330 start_codon:yes stop_codon:yes gene_type:complete